MGLKYFSLYVVPVKGVLTLPLCIIKVYLIKNFIVIINNIIASQSVPTFVQHIIGERIQEEETVTFEATFKGNPAPGIK